jgi:hypothetical protein
LGENLVNKIWRAEAQGLELKGFVWLWNILLYTHFTFDWVRGEVFGSLTGSVVGMI